jgi:glutaminase
MEDSIGRVFSSLEKVEGSCVSKGQLLEILENSGIREKGSIAGRLFREIERYKEDLSRKDFKNLYEKNKELLSPLLKNSLVIPDFKSFSQKVREIFEDLKDCSDGDVANYISVLANENINSFGVGLCSIDGQRFSLGDSKAPFTLQSLSKLINYCQSLENLGAKKVHEHVGREPSGKREQGITLNHKSRPHNPFLNTGGIMTTSLLFSKDIASDRFDNIISIWERASGGEKVFFNNTVYLQELQKADKNKALAYFMHEKKAFPKETDLSRTLELYFQSCSLEMNCESLSVVSATLANGGRCPVSGEDIFSAETVKHCLSLMSSCGMNDFSGEFAFRVGLPATSGASGGMMLIIPNLLGLCIWSPPLDKNGHSVRGVNMCEKLVNLFNFHVYDDLVMRSGDFLTSSKIDPRLKKDQERENRSFTLLNAVAKGSLKEASHLFAQNVDPNLVDYDGRTALHVAVAEGHLNLIKFLISRGASILKRDRWGNTPLDEAKRLKKKNIAELLDYACFKEERF